MVDVTYVGNTSKRLWDVHNPNAPFLGTGPIEPRLPYYSKFPGYFGMTFVEKRGNANYHGLQVTLTKRFSRGLSFLTNYTWSHAIENAFSYSGGGVAHQDEPNLDADRGNSANDVRHRFVWSSLDELPLGRNRPYGSNASGLVNAFLGG